MSIRCPQYFVHMPDDAFYTQARARFVCKRRVYDGLGTGVDLLLRDLVVDVLVGREDVQLSERAVELDWSVKLVAEETERLRLDVGLLPHT